MKRPMLWAAAMFALGEVISLFAGDFALAGIMIIMPVFGVQIIIKENEKRGNKKKGIALIILSLFVLLGSLNVRLRDFERKGEPKGSFERDAYGTEYKADGGVLGYGTEDKADGGVLLYGKISEYGIVYKLDEKDTGTDLYIRLENGLNVIVFGYSEGGVWDTENSYREKSFGEEGYGYAGYGDVSYRNENYGDVGYGDVVRLEGKLTMFEHASNPGCFDFKNYYKSRNICGSLRNYDLKIVSKNTNPFYTYLDFLSGIKRKSRDGLYSITDEKTAGIYSGILLGDRKSVDEFTRLDFQNNGIAHILAISGLHISLIFGIIYKVLRKLRLNRYAAGIVGFLILLSYAFMTGFSMSTLRALCMIVLSLIAIYTGESYDMPTALSVSLFIILLYQPFRITDSSVLMSIMAIVGICVGQYIIKHIEFFYYVNTFPKKVCAAFVFSISVNVVMFPVIIYIYHEVTVYSIFLNLLVIPLMTVVVLSGLIGIAVSFVSMSFGSYVIKPGAFILKVYEWLCKLTYRLPFGRINIGRINALMVFLYYVMMFLLLILFNKRFLEVIRMKLHRRFKVSISFKKWCLLRVVFVALVLGVFSGGIIFIYRLYCGELIVFLDVGQGDGILLRSESGVNMVIDGGSTSEDELGRYVMLPAIKYYGMSHIDYWFISHTDKDHISGLVYILELGERSGVKIDNLVFSYAMEDEDAFEKLLTLAVKNEINVMFMETGDYVTDESFELVCTHPDMAYETDDINDASLCLSYISDDCSALFTGDMGDDALEYMLLNEREYLFSDYDILKVPHHGSRNSIDWDFYNQICFETAVISCGENNSYGHPHEEVLEMLDRLGVRIRRTDLDGAFMILK